MQRNERLEQLEKAPLSKLLLQYSLPAIIGMAAMSIYHLTDSYFVGRWCGSYAVSGFALVFPIVNLMVAFGALVGMGGAASLSIALGKGDQNLAFRILGHNIQLPLILNTSVGALLYFFLPEVLDIFGVTEETYQPAYDFMAVTAWTFPITASFMNLNHLTRASGYPKKAMWCMVATVIANIILAPIFIHVLGWGMTGTALATAGAQIFGLCITIPHFLKKDSTVHFRSGIYKLSGPIVRRIFSIGMPMCLLNICGCVVITVFNYQLLNYEGPLGVGALGIVNRYSFIFIMVVMGIAQGMQPIVGFNQGIGNYSRVKGTLFRAMAMGTLSTSIGFITCQLWAQDIVSCFINANDPLANQLIALGTRGMQLFTLAFFIIGAQSIIGTFFQFIGKPAISIVLNLSRQVIILLPLLFILPHFLGSDGIWIAAAVSDVGAGIVCWSALFIYLHHIRKKTDFKHKKP